ncbi:S41 family peptidase [Brevundimonas sp. 2R-24]|uniref:S41 family peptidase n=1 Tax=Peiella sedimenti TaxID=3061083 RepID=A0ABT8SPS6_9CAUL|nr:S41 family peptidase [Caulobacteraceae bacterium XZ-24]
MSRHLLKAFACATALLAAIPAEAGPRETVQEIAEAIRHEFYDAAAAARIADALEAEAARGAYDAETDPRDLATVLTGRLKPEDPHFQVNYDPVGHAGVPAPGLPTRLTPPEAAAFDNNGFAEVRILPGNLGYIRMSRFANINWDDPNDPARAAADAALALVGNTEAVIFDLRGNGGGAPSMVGYLSSAFVGEQDIYNRFINRRGEGVERPRVLYPRPRLDVPVYILISGRSGSAAEGFPYTLQSARRATIVGEASGGASNPGGFIPLSEGFAVFVSRGTPRNPFTGTNWGGAGVQPDIAAPQDEALTAAQRAALERTIVAAPSPGRAEAARWALAALNPVNFDLRPYEGTYGPATAVAEDDRLVLRSGRRPPLTLIPVEPDQFILSDDPTVRYRFERDGDGRVIAMERLSLSGPSARTRRVD